METGEIIAMSENDDWLKKWIWGRTGSAYLFDHHRGVLKDLAQAEVDATRIKFSQLRRRVVETEKVDAKIEADEDVANLNYQQGKREGVKETLDKIGRDYTNRDGWISIPMLNWREIRKQYRKI